MWDLPGTGIEPRYPSLAGTFLTTVPPGKSPGQLILNEGGKIYIREKTVSSAIGTGRAGQQHVNQ